MRPDNLGVSQATPSTYLSLRIPRTLAADLKSIALKEANTQSAVARRLLSAGLWRELRADERRKEESESQ
jgi:hypothetical protein